MNNNTGFKYMVCTECFTYNHLGYIKDTLIGFEIQHICFPVVSIVIDDASTDGAQDFLRNWAVENLVICAEGSNEYDTDYAHVIEAQLKHNPLHTVVIILLKENLFGKKEKLTYLKKWVDNSKYIALCEGDDYWIDPLKLQKQIDYMESHPECSYCGTNGIVIWEGGAKRPRFFNKITQAHCLSSNEIIGKWIFPTASCLFRTHVLEEKNNSGINTYGEDQTLILIAMSMGEVYAMPDISCVYRRVGLSDMGSVTNRARRKGREYITEQHIALYTLFNEYTKGDYANVILPHISKLNRRRPVYKAMNRSYLLAFLRNPIVFTAILFEKIKEKAHV